MTTTPGALSFEPNITADNPVAPRPLGFPDTENPIALEPTTFPVGTGQPNASQMLAPHSTGYPTAAFSKPSACDTSTPVMSQLPVPPHTSVTSTTPHHSQTGVNSLARTAPFVSPSLRTEADVFTPTSADTVYHAKQPTSCTTASSHSTTDNVLQIAEALAKVTQLQRLPQAKPDVFRGDESDTKFFIWETAFDALIDSAPISAQQKLYLLYQHLDGKAKRVVEQLQYVVGANPEKAYREARKRLKQRFGRSAIVATDFENKLTNWPKIANNDAIGIREFSDFLQQVEIASEHLPALKIFEYPSKIQALVDKLPNWFTVDESPDTTATTRV